LDVGVDVLFVEIFVFVVGVYELFSSRSAREDEGTGEGRVRCEDCVEKERSREETPESFKVDDACDVVRGGEGGQVVDGEARVDVINGGDNFLDGVWRCSVVNNDGYGYNACSDEASDFVRWTEEGPTEVMGFVEDGDRPCASRR